MRDFLDIVISERNNMSSLTFDADGFSNACEYRNSYHIPENERLLVYANSEKCKDALFGRGTIITEEAIYIHPSNALYTEAGRIPLSDICSFLVYENKNSDVMLFGPQKEYQIFAGVGRGKEKTAADLVKLLKEVQSNLLLASGNREIYEKTVKRIYTAIRSQMRECGVLSADFLALVKVMEDISFFKREAIFLELENIYRTCNKAAYDRLLDEKAKDLSWDTAEVLKNPDDVFYVSFINDLTKGEFSNVKAIIDSYLRLKALPRLSYKQACVLSYLCVRMEDFDYLNELLDEMGDDLPEEELWGLFKYVARSKNRKTHRIQVKIAGLNEVLEEELLFTNDLGLCSLHYAMMLRNKELIRYILPHCDWSKIKSPFPKDRIADALFEPMFAAAIIFKDKNILKDIFKYTSPQATALNRSIKGVESMIDINTALLKKYPEHRAEYEDKIAEFVSMKNDMEAELSKLAEMETQRQIQMASIIRDAGHPLGDYLLNLYSSTQSFLAWLKYTERDFRLSRYKNTFFVTEYNRDVRMSFYEFTNDEITDTFVSDSDKGYSGKNYCEKTFEERNASFYDNPSYRAKREEERRLEEERRRKREEFEMHVKNPTPYNGSWFSESAHKNIRALKEEYRILVKKYHPDSSGDNKTAKILMRIMSERADILEKMR